MPIDKPLAAIDLGSNSFRMEIGRYQHGIIQRIEYIKETVRQGNGLDENRNLTEEAMQRGWDCLSRFGERIADFKTKQVRAVATQTLREARNRDVFLKRATQILGFPIEVISGKEEARLIYLGVSQLLPQSDEKRMVVDIGGRSTEIILGRNKESKQMESYRVGSVAWSIKYFPNGIFSAESFKKSEVAAKAILDEAVAKYPPHKWDVVYGSSGTIGAVADALAMSGYSGTTITKEGVLWLINTLIRAQSVDRLRIDGLKEDRKAVIGGGLSVLSALMDLLQIDSMQVAEGSLRHGVLYDMIDRDMDDTDIRSSTVKRLAVSMNTDLDQGARVSAIAQYFLEQIDPVSDQKDRLLRKIKWAAQLHEIGTAISHSDYHKHGAYILDNTDTTGFTQTELHRLSLLVLGHRGKLKKLEHNLDDIDLVKQLLALRLAVILCHARRDPDVGDLKINWNKNQPNKFTLKASAKWRENFPQSAHLLYMEMDAWQRTSYKFEFKND